MKRFIEITTLAATALFMTGANVAAWNEIGHFAIGQEAGYSWEECTYMNLPDLWDPNFLNTITDAFCWSHAVQRNTNYVAVPPVPQYANDDREPGSVMKTLINKIDWNRHGGSAAKAIAEKTAMGFSKHNAADRNVHYAFFLGGSKDDWTINHGQKELWADYWVYVRVVCGASDEAEEAEEADIWDANGKAKQFYGVSLQQSGKIVNIQANAFIIRMAQEAARKNRRTVDVAESIPYNKVDSITSIDSLVTQRETEFNNKLKGLTRQGWVTQQKVARDNGWDEYVILTTFRESVERLK